MSFVSAFKARIVVKPVNVDDVCVKIGLFARKFKDINFKVDLTTKKLQNIHGDS